MDITRHNLFMAAAIAGLRANPKWGGSGSDEIRQISIMAKAQADDAVRECEGDSRTAAAVAAQIDDSPAELAGTAGPELKTCPACSFMLTESSREMCHLCEDDCRTNPANNPDLGEVSIHPDCPPKPIYPPPNSLNPGSPDCFRSDAT